MRLSKDDENSSESTSIQNQRKMLRAYADENNFFVYDEYIDDGWSGTNFDRPGWQRMISDIESQKINMIIAKDLSRLGRNYITAGQYTEIYFPSKSVRCIAINDGYDSDSPYSDIAPFKNVINEMYARDISKKIRSAFQTKMNEGSYIGNFAPYGYMKDPKNKNHLIIDYAVAPIIKEMFIMAENGNSPSEIAKTFNNKKILTPAMYRCSKRPYLNINNYSLNKEWSSSMVCKMLRNIVYLGHIAQGKTTKVSFKSHTTIQNSQEDWIVAYNMHEPIISQETFENAAKRSISRRIKRKTDFNNIFSGIAKCADCGHNMSITVSRKKDSCYNLTCGSYKLYGNSKCSNHFIDYNFLYKIIIEDIKKHLKLSESEKKEVINILNSFSIPSIKENESNITLKKREAEIDCIIERLYEDNVNGVLNNDRFLKLLCKYETEQKEIKSQISYIKKDSNNNNIDNNEYNLNFLINNITEKNRLSVQILKRFIDKIEICQGNFNNTNGIKFKNQTVKIYYKFIP